MISRTGLYGLYCASVTVFPPGTEKIRTRFPLKTTEHLQFQNVSVIQCLQGLDDAEL